MTYRFKGEVLTSREEAEEYLQHGLFRSKTHYEVPDELWDKALYLWARYHATTERFDRACCTGWRYGDAIPVNHEQRMMSYQNADRQRLLLERESSGIPLELFREANQVVIKWGLAEQEAFCKNYEWRRAMIIKCEKHGEVIAEPNANGDVFCPQCIITEDITHQLHVDKAKPGTEMNAVTVISADGEVLGSIQSFKPSDRKVLERVYNLEKGRGSYSMGCAVQGHMPCKLCEPGQRAEEKRLEYCPSCGRLLPFGKGLLGFTEDPPFEKPTHCPDCGWELKKEPSQYEQFLGGLKKADLIESYRMTGEDTAEIKMKNVVNWLNRVGWSRLE